MVAACQYSCACLQASHGQRSVGDIVAIEVREASHCVVLSPLRKADEEQLLCMEFFLKGCLLQTH